MSSSSLSRCNTKKNSNPFESPEAKKKKEGYEDYDLSPPKLRKRDQRKFEDAVNAIQSDFKGLLRLEWVDDEKVLEWFKKRPDGTETELPMEFRRIFLFLYSRNFKKNAGQNGRRAAVRVMLSKGNIRKVIRQVINCGGDNDLSSQEDYRNQYIRVCTALFRYFQQDGASGFSQDMSSLIYYLRMQKMVVASFKRPV